MDLYLIRHAEAHPLKVGHYEDDAARPLTDAGQAHARALGKSLSRKGIHLDKIVTSPLVRARQTAEGVCAGWEGSAPEMVTCEDLAPGGKRRKLAKFLRQLGAPAVAAVGHQPDINELAAWLVGSKKAQIVLAKGGVAHIVCEDDPGKGAGMLAFLLTPEWEGLP